jgi:phosphoadenosine phosphosulfate reductase
MSTTLPGQSTTPAVSRPVPADRAASADRPVPTDRPVPANRPMPADRAMPPKMMQGDIEATSSWPTPSPATPTSNVVTPTPEFLAELKAHSDRLETATPQEIIAWAVKTYHPKLTMATAFGPEGCVIMHMLAQIEPSTHVFNLNTGYQFKETLELRDRIEKRYGIAVEMKEHMPVEQYEALHGGPVYKTDTDKCCFDRKVSVLRQAAVGWSAWMTAIRRDQSADRANAAIVGWDKKFNLIKINPLANWTKSQVWQFITDHDVPYNPLHDQGYPSIGCWPCTRSVMFGEDERAGRWSGTAKTECGLHTLDKD